MNIEPRHRKQHDQHEDDEYIDENNDDVDIAQRSIEWNGIVLAKSCSFSINIRACVSAQ
jgi:hypothetical protein